MSHQELYEPLAAHIAKDFPLVEYRPSRSNRGFCLLHKKIVLQITLYPQMTDKELHMEIQRLRAHNDQFADKLIQSILRFCANHNYFPIAKDVTDLTRSFWENVAGFRRNPEHYDEYIHPAFDPFLHYAE